MLHVHDLVDYVSEEAAAGRHAADYIAAGGAVPAGRTLPVTGQNGVHYTVPASICPEAVAAGSSLPLRFRVDNVYRGKTTAVYAGDTCLVRKKTPRSGPRRDGDPVAESPPAGAAAGNHPDYRDLEGLTP